jgi:hypothetical protein
MAAYYRWQYAHIVASLAIWTVVLGLSVFGLVLTQEYLVFGIFLVDALYMGVILVAHARGIRLPQWLVPKLGRGSSNLPARPGESLSDPEGPLPVSESATRLAQAWRGLSFTKKVVVAWLVLSGGLGGMLGFLLGSNSVGMALFSVLVYGPLEVGISLAVPCGIIIIIGWLKKRYSSLSPEAREVVKNIAIKTAVKVGTAAVAGYAAGKAHDAARRDDY